MSEFAKLVCWTISGDDDATTSLQEGDRIRSQPLNQESGKKSSFLLDLDGAVLEKPAQTQIIVEGTSAQRNPFFLGGFQIVSNAKQSDVYLTSNDGKEKYLTTSKGIPFEKGSGELWFKAVCVIPGGPRSVKQLRLKLDSLQPADATTTRVKFLKLTARIPDKAAPPQKPSPARGQLGAMPLAPMQGSGSAFTPPHPSALASMFQAQQGAVFPPTSTNLNVGAVPSAHPSFTARSPPVPTQNTFQPPPSNPPLTQDDLGAAMAGISMMARSTQEEMQNSMKHNISTLQQNLDARWTKMEGYISSLTTVVVSQKSVLDEKSKIMMQQHEMISEQSRQISALIREQQNLVATVRTLQSNVSDLGQHLTTTSARIGQKQHQQQEEIVSVVKSIQNVQQQKLSPAIKSIESNVSELCQNATENSTKSNDQQQALSSTVESLHSEVDTLRQKVEATTNNGTKQEEMTTTLNALQSEVSTFRQSMKEFLNDDNEQQNELAATLQSLQLDVSNLRETIEETPDERDSAQQQQTLLSTVQALQVNFDDLRRSMKENTEGGNRNKNFSSTVESLQWDLSELRRSVKENAEEMRGGKKQVPYEERREIVLNGSQDFPDNVLALRSLETTDTFSGTEETPSDDNIQDVPEFQVFKSRAQQSKTNTDGEKVLGIAQKLNSASPPSSQSSPNNEFREITNDKDVKQAGSNDSCPGLETIEVSLMIDDEADILRENNNSACQSAAIATSGTKEAKQSPQLKQKKQVLFKEVGLEDRFEYELSSSLSRSHDDSQVASTEDEDDTSVFERGLQLFKYYSES